MILLEKYRLIQEIKSSAMSMIYLTQHIYLKSFWIIKKIKSQDTSFENELNILKQLNHPSIPLTVDVISQGDVCYIIREYVEGLTLEEHIVHCGVLKEEEVLQIGIQLCEVLAYLHQAFDRPIIYRDMKPSNIIIKKDGSVRLIDFSIARYYDAQKIKDTNFLGTKGFAAPEQYGFSQSDIRTDIFGVGATLHYCLTQNDLGKPPYRFHPLREYRQDISIETERVILKATSMSKHDRFSNSEELKNALMLGLEKKEENWYLRFKELAGRKIGFCSLKKGLGATYHAFHFAKECMGYQKRVLLIDCSDKEDLLELEYHKEADFIDGLFVFQGISILSWKKFVEQLRKGRIDEFLSMDYFLFDFGNRGVNHFGDAFDKMKAYLDKYLIIASVNPWNLPLFDEYIMKEQDPKEGFIITGSKSCSDFMQLKNSLSGLQMFRHVYGNEEDVAKFVKEVFLQWEWEGEFFLEKRPLKIPWGLSGIRRK